MTGTDPVLRVRSSRRYRLLYLLAGGYFGWRWAFDAHGPAWEHAAGVLVQMLVLSAVVQLLQRRASRRGQGRSGGGQPFRLPLRQLVLGKLLLVVAALAAEYLLHRWTSNAHLVIGAGLFLAIALGGPVLQRRHEAGHAEVHPSPRRTPGR
ncbi:hypothetical protein ABVB69_27840 [Streptomyces sp. NPDC000349]|uniref:hypothetical protein n=1 Tax=unclassified Streptomyces TaxID=2593676 RepID=UPI00277D65C7|nr:hypothetical protein [Streptomyces sp. DSM 40167]MDQ0401481.1 hypothetical protein [Streptomyces sp. DSM 40167]